MGLAQARHDTPLPALQDTFERFTKVVGQDIHLYAEVPDEAAARVAMAGHAFAGVFDEGAKPFQRGARVVLQPAVELRAEVRIVRGHQFAPERFLALEVVIERALGNVHALEDGVQPRGRETLFGQHFHARTNERCACVRMGARVFRRPAAAWFDDGRFHADDIRPIVYKIQARGYVGSLVGQCFEFSPQHVPQPSHGDGAVQSGRCICF